MTFRALIEGTQAAIIVKTGDDEYSMAYLQYDGSTVGDELKKFQGKDALKLVSKSGEIRGIDNGKIEFYDSRILLKTGLNSNQVIKEANAFSNYAYYYDGKEWYKTSQKIKSLDHMKPM